MKIGIPRSLFYYLDGDIVINFLKELNIDTIISPNTNKEIIDKGIFYAPDEMCLSGKNYLGHVSYLVDKCDYILVPRIDNYYTFNQTCTNFLAMYDIVSNIFKTKVIGYNIDLNNKETLKKGLIRIGKKLGKKNKDIMIAYKKAIKKHNYKYKKLIKNNMDKLNSDKTKILLLSHNYNTYDQMIGKPVIELLEKMGIEIIYSDLFDKSLCRTLSKNISNDLYWKNSREIIGSFKIAKNRIDGVVILSAFPCGLDSLVNELLMLKINIPYLNIVIDDLDATNGLETRIESFADIITNFKN